MKLMRMIAETSDIQESMNEIMGFIRDTDITLVPPTPPNATLFCESEIPITMSPGVQNLYMTIRNSCNNYGNANVANVFSSSNILAKIPVSNPPFSTLYFFDLNSNFSTVITNKYLDNLTITLFNERFTQIEPRKNWSFTMKIEILQTSTTGRAATYLEKILSLTQLKMVKKDKNAKKSSNIKSPVESIKTDGTTQQSKEASPEGEEFSQQSEERNTESI